MSPHRIGPVILFVVGWMTSAAGQPPSRTGGGALPAYDPTERSIDEINSGNYAFDYRALAAILGRLSANNSQGEYYLTDTVRLLLDSGRPAAVRCAPDHRTLLGINTPAQLAEAERIHRELEGAAAPGTGDS